MKKWQTWTVVTLVAVLIALTIGGIYYLLTMDSGKGEEKINQAPVVVEGETELEAADKSLRDLEALNLSEVEKAQKELSELDMSGI